MEYIDIGYTTGLPFQDEDGQWRIKVYMLEGMISGEGEDLIEPFLCLPYGLLNAPPEGTTVKVFYVNNTNQYAIPICADSYMVQLQQNGVRTGNLQDNIYLDFTPAKILLMHKNINILDNINERDIDIKNGFTNARGALTTIQTAFTAINAAPGTGGAAVGAIKAAAGTAATALNAFITAIQTVENNIQTKYNEIDNLIT